MARNSAYWRIQKRDRGWFLRYRIVNLGHPHEPQLGIFWTRAGAERWIRRNSWSDVPR